MIRKINLFSHISKKAAGFFRILPRLVSGEGMLLRFIRMKDMTSPPFSAGSGKKPSALSLWKELFDSYQGVYLIAEKEDPDRAVGFIGLYGMVPGRSSYVSIVIWDEKDRMRGYGSRGMRLMLDYLRKKSIIRVMCAEVAQDNYPSRSFFEGLGFEFRGKKGEVLLFEKDLGASGG